MTMIREMKILINERKWPMMKKWLFYNENDNWLLILWRRKWRKCNDGGNISIIQCQ